LGGGVLQRANLEQLTSCTANLVKSEIKLMYSRSCRKISDTVMTTKLYNTAILRVSILYTGGSNFIIPFWDMLRE